MNGRTLPALLAVLFLVSLVPSAAAQAQPVEDGEHVEILRVSNPTTVTKGVAFPLQATLQNHKDMAITVAVFATLHAAGQDPACKGGDASYGEVTQHDRGDGTVDYVHETVRLDPGEVRTVPDGSDWTGVVLDANGLPGPGDYTLCYWIESPTKTQTGPDGQPQPVYPWFYDRYDVPVQVLFDDEVRVHADPLEVRGSVAAGTPFSVRTTLHDPFPESVEVRLTGTLHAESCADDALAGTVLDALEVRVPGGGDRTVSILADGGAWQGNVPADAIAASGQYVLCLHVTPVQSDLPGDVQGTTVYVRKDNHAPAGVLDPGLVRWGPKTEIPFHLDATDADGDPVSIRWEFAGGDAAVGPDADFTVPYLGTFELLITLDDGFQETHLVCLVPVPGDQATKDNAIHGCPTAAVPEGSAIPAPGLLPVLGLAMLLARRR